MDSVDKARALFLSNQVQQATASLEAILANEAAYSEDALFDARCIRGSISALLGPKEDPYLSQLRPKTRQEGHIKNYLDATTMIRNGQPLSAIVKLQGILREDPHFLAARMGLAAAHMAEKQWKEAFQQYSEVLATTGKNAPAIVRVGLALCAMRREEFEHAKKCLLRALEIEPNDDFACMAMIVVQLQQRDGPGAAESVKRLYGLAPENPIAVQKFADLVFFKGVTTNRLGDINHAIRDLIATAVKLDEGNVSKDARRRIAYSRFQLGRLEHFDGKFEAAVGLYNEAIAVLGTSCKSAVLYLTKACYQLDKINEAVQCLERLEEERKADKDVYAMLIAHNVMTGNNVRGMYYAQKLTDEFGIGDPRSYWLRAFTSRHSTTNALKNIAIAKLIPNQQLPEKIFQTEEFLRSQQPATQAASLGEMLSTLQKIRNEKDDAQLVSPAAVTVALRSSPELLPHYYNIACTMASSSVISSSASSAAPSSELSGTRLQTARQIFVAIVKVFPTFIDSYYRLAEIFVAHKQFPSAFKWLSLALHVRPNDGHCLAMLAKLYFDGRNARVAVETLKRGMNAVEENDTVGTDPAKDKLAAARRNNTAIPSMALGSLLLWSAQQPSDKAPRHLLSAKECFSRPLRIDPCNALAAHGLACAVGFGGNSVSKGARSELTENTLATVNAITVNDASLQENVSNNMINCFVKSQSHKRVIDAFLPRLSTLSSTQIGTLGYSLAADGQLEEAYHVIEKGLAQSPHHQALRYNSILILYARITREIGASTEMTDEKGREIRALLVKASDLSHSFVSQKHSGTEMSVSAFIDAQQNVKAMAKQLIRLEECLQAAVRKASINKKYVEKKQQEWRMQAAQNAADEAQRQAELKAMEEEAERMKADTSRRRYDALKDMQKRGGVDNPENLLAMVTGYEGEVVNLGEGDQQGGQPEVSADDLADSLAAQALAV